MIANRINEKTGIAPIKSSVLTVSATQPVMATPMAVVAGMTAVAAVFTAGIAVGVTVS